MCPGSSELLLIFLTLQLHSKELAFFSCTFFFFSSPPTFQSLSLTAARPDSAELVSPVIFNYF